MSKKIAVVVCSHLQEYFDKFINVWQDEFSKFNITLYLNEDHQKKEFIIPKTNFKIKHYSWEDHEKDFGDNSWIISRKTSAGKSYGFYRAYLDNMDIIISLDHDCYPDQDDTIQKHIDILSNKVSFGWDTSCGIPTRGFPYNIRGKTKVVLNHGVWSNIPDFDGPQMLQYPEFRLKVESKMSRVIAKNNYFPLCGMNFSFVREATPALYFLLMGPDWPFDRFDDIWAGIFFKKISDHLKFAVTTGYPSIHHDKGTDPFVAVKKEASGLPVNEWLWKEVDKVILKNKSFKLCYIELAEKLKKSKVIEKSEHKDYFSKLFDGMIIWASLF